MPSGSFESLTIRVAFIPTSGTTTSAFGLLQAVSVDGTDSGTLDVRTKGLTSGTYTVSAVTDSGTAPVVLGAFHVRGASVSGSATPATTPPPPHTNTHFGGRHGIPFPDSVDPFDIASLAISDSNSNVLFTADLTTVNNGSFFARTPIVSGTTVTATGVASIHAVAVSGTVTGALKVWATGLPDSTTYNYYVNGAEIGQVTTGTSGSLKLVATEEPTGGTLPSSIDLFSVTSVTVEDTSGNVILTGSF